MNSKLVPLAFLLILAPAGIVAENACESPEGCSEDALSLLQVGLNMKPWPAFEKVSPGDRCAVCFIGELRGLDETRHGMKRNLLNPLAQEGVNVDVFVAGAAKGPFTVLDFGLDVDNSTRASMSEPLHGQRGQIAIRDSRVEPEPPIDELEKLITDAAPKAALLHYRAQPGVFMGPLFGQEGNGIRIYRHEAECADMVQKYEESHNLRYKWIVRTRTDFRWLAPHPPLSLLRTDMAWTFDSEEYHGVNVRHVVGGRDVMLDGLLSKLHLLQTGDPVVYKMHNPDVPEGTSYWAGDEVFSAILFDKLNIHKARMATVAHLVACPEWSTSSWRNDPHRNARGRLIPKQPKEYPEEVSLAESNAAKIEDQGCTWELVDYDKLGLENCRN